MHKKNTSKDCDRRDNNNNDNNKWEFAVAYPPSGTSSTDTRLNWNNFGNVGSCGGGKPEDPAKNLRSRDENRQQTQPTY